MLFSVIFVFFVDLFVSVCISVFVDGMICVFCVGWVECVLGVVVGVC